MNFFPLIAEGSSVATAQLEVQVLPGPFRIRPDLTVAYDEDLLISEPTSVLVGGRQVVTYRLDPRARWNDGRPINAEDFAFSWRIQRSSDPARGGCPRLLTTTGYDQIASVSGTDGGRTVVVTFSRPFADWKSLFNQTLFPTLMDRGDPEANCAMIGKGWPVKDGIPFSGGPWKIDKANVDPAHETVTLTPNPAYWGRRPKVDRLIWQSIGTDAGVVVKALRSGEIDLADPPPQLDLVGQLKALEPKVRTEIRSGLVFDHLDFNTANPHLGQKAVREAIATALDRPALVRSTVGQIDHGARILNNRYYMTNQPEYEATNGGRYEHGDVGAARRLLEGAGYTPGSDGVYVQQGRRLSLELMTTPTDRLRADAIEVIAAQLKPAGIEIRTFRNRDIFGDKDKPSSLESHRFDIALYSWISGPFVTYNETIYQSPQQGKPSQNYTGGGNRQVDELLRRLAGETEPTRLVATANQIDRLLWDDLYTIPLYQRPIIVAHNGDCLNVGANAANVGPGWNANEWELRR